MAEQNRGVSHQGDIEELARDLLIAAYTRDTFTGDINDWTKRTAAASFLIAAAFVEFRNARRQ